MRLRRDTKEKLMMSVIVLISISLATALTMKLGSIADRDNHYIKPEYNLEILSQDSVMIQNITSGRTYTVHIDSIQSTLQLDNL